MPRFQAPRGTRDFLLEEMEARNGIMDTFRKAFESYGFRPVDTPAFESWDMLSKKGGGGEAVKDEIYFFKDKSGRELGLRFDLTVPLARMVAANPSLRLPFKRYQIGKVWRYDRPQAGRMREFVQADVDIVGSASMLADAECIAVAVECLRRLGFSGFTIKLNNRKILEGMVELAGIPPNLSPAVFRALDKLEKAGSAEVVKELSAAGVGKGCAEKLISLTMVNGRPGQALPRVRKMFRDVGTALAGIGELEEIVKLSKPYGTERFVSVDLSLVRGLDYYTGPIFEVSVKTKRSVGSVAGGGRYDRLIGLYGGRDTPATGISFGVERIFEIMRSEGMADGAAGKGDVFIVSVNDTSRPECLKLSGELRDAGVRAETDLMGRDLRKQLDYANRRGMPFAVIVGPKEVKSKRFTLRDMKTGKESKASLKGIMRKLEKAR